MRLDPPRCHLQALLALRAQGKRLLFVTNNSSKSRQQYVSKFAGLGIEVAPAEIVASSYAAAAYLQCIGARPGRLPGASRRSCAGHKALPLPATRASAPAQPISSSHLGSHQAGAASCA
jgi:phosphoglycolate phosphatase